LRTTKVDRDAEIDALAKHVTKKKDKIRAAPKVVMAGSAAASIRW
jgi:hypothetical protein